MIIKNLTSKMDTLHNDNKQIIALLENISEKEKIVIKVTKETKSHTSVSNNWNKDLWELY